MSLLKVSVRNNSNRILTKFELNFHEFELYYIQTKLSLSSTQLKLGLNYCHLPGTKILEKIFIGQKETSPNLADKL